MKCCNLVKAKQLPVHNENISVLLRHAQRHSGKILCWMLSLELHEKPDAVNIMNMFF